MEAGAAVVSQWTWQQRSRRIRSIVIACWSAYVVISIAGTLLIVSPVLHAIPDVIVLVLAILAAFIVPPAWIHIAWVHFPGYLFMSNGIRRVGFSDIVRAQVSVENNRANAFGVPPLAEDLRTAVPQPTSFDAGSGSGEATTATVVWDDYLYTPSSILFPKSAFPTSTCRASLQIGSDSLTLTAGRWRPATVIELPFAMIVGVWNGSEIATIDSGRVLVVVVDNGDDELLFPFEITRWKDRPREHSAVDGLIRLIDQRRRG